MRALFVRSQQELSAQNQNRKRTPKKGLLIVNKTTQHIKITFEKMRNYINLITQLTYPL